MLSVTEGQNNENSNENQNLKDSYLNPKYDRYATIEFTSEDLKRIRRPNPQPLDQDYFSHDWEEETKKEQDGHFDESSMVSQEDSSSSLMEEQYHKYFSQKSSETPCHDEESDHLTPQEEASKEVSQSNDEEHNLEAREEKDLVALANELEDSLELDIDDELYQRHHFEENDVSDSTDQNPFEYQSITSQLRQESVQHRQQHNQPGFFQKLLQTIFIRRGEMNDGEDYDAWEEDSLSWEVEDEEPVVLDQPSEKEATDSKMEEVEESVDSNREQLSDSMVTGSENVEELVSENEKKEETEDINSNQIIVNENSLEDEVDKVPAELSTSEEGIELKVPTDSEIYLADESSQLDNQMYSDEDLERIAKDLPDFSEIEDDLPKTTLAEKLKARLYQEMDQLRFKSQEALGKAKDKIEEIPLFSDDKEEVKSNKYHSSKQIPLDNPSKEVESREEVINEVEDGEDSDESVPEILLTQEEMNLEHPEEVSSLTPDQSDAQSDAYDLAEKVSQATASYQEPLLSDQILDEGLSMTEVNQFEEHSDQEDSRRFVSGVTWMTFGKMFSRIIGALYVIPWATWLGQDYTHANALYAVGYTPYAFFLAIATAGFPGAVAKQIAYYNSKKEFKVSDQIFKYALIIMLISGILASAIFFFAAPALAGHSSTDDPEAAVIVIRSLAPALLILPTMSLIRGYFQGFNNLAPFAISEVIEQIIRVCYLLVATFLITQTYHGSVTSAVAHSTFAAFVGALVALMYLLFKYWRHQPTMEKLKAVSKDQVQVDFQESMVLIVKDSIPFILLGSGIILAQIVDTYTFKQILVRTSILLNSEISQLFGAMNLDVNKLVMIVVSLAVAMASSTIPAVSAKYAKGDVNKTGELVKNIVLVFSFVMLPASVGMAMVADNLYPFFYPTGIEQGPSLLVTGSFMAIALGAYTVLATILQSMNYRRYAVSMLFIGILIKLILQFPMVALFQANGAMAATAIAFTVTSITMWMKIWRIIKIRDRYFVGDLIRIVIATLVMAIGAKGWNRALNALMDPVGRGLTFLQIMIVVIMAIVIYASIMALFGMLSIVIGDYRSDLQKRMTFHK